MKKERNKDLVIKAGESTAHHKRLKAPYASVAQLVELLTCNQWVEGSIPFASTIYAVLTQSGRVLALQARSHRFEPYR